MSTVLILCNNADCASALSLVVHQAGCTPVIGTNGERAQDALDRTQAHVVMVDTELPVGSAFVPSARRSGSLLLYVTSTLSAYELATYARRRGASHFPMTGGARMLRSMIDEAISQRQEFASVVVERPSAVAMRNARSSVSRARALVQRSQRVIESACVLRASNRIAVAVMSNRTEAVEVALRQSIDDLRRGGVTLERTKEILHEEVERARFSRGAVLPVWDAVAGWCEDAFGDGTDS